MSCCLPRRVAAVQGSRSHVSFTWESRLHDHCEQIHGVGQTLQSGARWLCMARVSASTAVVNVQKLSAPGI